MVNKITSPITPLNLIDKTNEIIDALGSGGVSIDNETITQNASDELQAVGVIDDNDGNPLKTWTGTKAQYDAIVTKDPDTLYNVTDDNTANAYEAYTKSEVDTMLAQFRGATFVNLTGVLGTTSGTITLNDSIQNYQMLLFGVGAVTAYNYCTCIAMPFPSLLYLNNWRWRINGDTIRLNFTQGTSSATSAMITLSISSNTSLEIITNTSNAQIRGVIGIKFS